MKIETKRLILRNWNFDDIDAIVDGLNDFDVAKFLTTPYPYHREDGVNFVNRFHELDDKNFYFAIIKKDSNEVIGGTSVRYRDKKDDTNGGIWLRKDCHGVGYGQEAYGAIINFWFEYLKNTEIVSGYYEYNPASEHMHKKLGFKPFGTEMGYCPALSQDVKVVCGRLKKIDFEKIKGKNFEFKVIE